MQPSVSSSIASLPHSKGPLHPPSAALTNKCLDLLRLANPKVWYAFVVAQSKNPFSKVDASALYTAVLGIVLPIVLISVLYQVVLPILFRRNPWPPSDVSRISSVLARTQRIGIATFASPWTLQCLYEVGEQLSYFWSKI